MRTSLFILHGHRFSRACRSWRGGLAALLGGGLLALQVGAALGRAPPAQPDWQPWGASSFELAKAQGKPIFLYLEAVWCHWCHVMQQQTLTDPVVREKLAASYVSVRVDHDANPLLADRFRDWGWPALIFLAADGTEIVKRAGFIAPQPFARLLDAIVADPSPETANVGAAARADEDVSHLSPALRGQLRAAHDANHDDERGGLRTLQKFLDRNSLEYDLSLALAGDARYTVRAQRTLDAAAALIDPVWGGVYQYSTGARWDRPHYEKIMRTQAGVLRAYALAYAAFGRESDRERAAAIIDYLLGHLRDPAAGAFYNSQDADLVPGQKAHDYFALDDAARRARGMPRIDRQLYAAANGLAVEALALAAAAGVDARALPAALAAARWLEQHRALAAGGYQHGADPDAVLYLADQLAVARGQLALHQATGKRRWLDRAVVTGEVIAKRFRSDAGGFVNATDDGTPVAALPVLEENIQLARFYNLLAHYSGYQSHQALATHAQQWLVRPAVATQPFEEAGILLVDRELGRDPAHLVVVGSGEAAQTLYARAARFVSPYMRLEWWDRSVGPLMHQDVSYPNFDRAAGYVCVAQRCSAPSFDVGRYEQQIRRLLGR